MKINLQLKHSCDRSTTMKTVKWVCPVAMQLLSCIESYLIDEHRKCGHALMKFRIVFGHSEQHFGLNPRLKESFACDLQ